MANCTNCGASLRPEYKRCIKCGSPVPETVAPSPAEDAASGSVRQRDDYEDAFEDESPRRGRKKRPKRKRTKSPKRKDPTLALILSCFFPGLGQLVNEEVGKGLAIILINMFIALPLTFVVVGFFISFGLWIYSMIDAYNGAKRYNEEYGL